MEQKGYIVFTTDNCVKIRVDRQSACGGNCVSCKGCPAEAVIIECKTDEEFNIGDEVILQMPTKTFFKKAFWGYGIPVMLAVLGTIIGYVIYKNDGTSILGAITGIIVGIIIAKLICGGEDGEIILKRKG